MRHLLRKLAVAATVILAVAVAGCNPESPGTSVRIALAYDDALGLDTAEVTLVDRTESARIAHQLLLLVPDQFAGLEIPVEVWGKKAGKRAAYGTTTAIARLGKTVAASLTLTQCTPGCQGNDLDTCTGMTVTCALGCSSDGDAHCKAPTPSNGVDPTQVDQVSGTTTISASATFNTDTGMITGGLDRQPGVGVDSGVGYAQVTPAAGAPLGIFVFHNLMVDAAATIRFTGGRAAVLLIADTAKIAGVIDVAAGHGTRSAPGPGGGAGADTGVAQGCAPGAPGTSAAKIDGGGGGGGGGTTAGDGGAVNQAQVGAGGVGCLPIFLEPLQGGSGGGSGGRGSAPSGAVGGGGGGALQITAFGSLEISGTINAGGAGGAGGIGSATDGGGGGGGGGGGALLLEAPLVIVEVGALVTANGGGGGGGGGVTQGLPGEDGGISVNPPPQGGSGMEAMSSTGGSGGALDAPPDFGGNGTTNGGGGGGGAGAVVIRGHTRTVLGTVSPLPVADDVKSPQ